MTHDKNKNPLLHLLSNYISPRTAPQILSLKDDYTFRFSSFLIIGLRNSSANLQVWPKPLATQVRSEGHWFDKFNVDSRFILTCNSTN